MKNKGVYNFLLMIQKSEKHPYHLFQQEIQWIPC